MRATRFAPALLAVLLVATGCGGGASRFATIDQVVPDFMDGDLELAVIPTPVDAELTLTLATTRGFRIEAPPGDQLGARRWLAAGLPSGPTPVRVGSTSNAAVRDHLARHGVTVDWAWLGREGYVLDVRTEGDVLVVAIAANSSEGVLWGLETLRQISWRSADGRVWVRRGTVRDRPAFVDRGSGEAKLGESLYKANFVWGKPPSLEMQRRGRWSYIPSWAQEDALDASPGAVRDAVDFFEEWSIRGSRAYCMRFDDRPFRLDRLSGTDERFDSNYAAGLVSYLRAVRAGINGFDGTARVFWLPQTYSASHPGLMSFAEAISAEGGLPRDIGLVVTGARVLSENIDAKDVDLIRQVFGAMSAPALVWDVVSVEPDFSPLTGRDPDLLRVASGVVGDGTMIKRITRLDWSWNPRAYDAQRSLRLAVRELAGPSAYRATLALVEALASKPRDDARLPTLLTAVERAWGDRTWRRDLERDDFLRALRAAVGEK